MGDRVEAATEAWSEFIGGNADENYIRPTVEVILNESDAVDRKNGIIRVDVHSASAVEAVTKALSGNWNNMHTNESLGRQRMLAQAVLAALPEASDG